jgi:transcriptional regulator with XRE-family HTH domain
MVRTGGRPRTKESQIPIIQALIKYRKYIGMSSTQAARRMGMKSAKAIYYIECSGFDIRVSSLLKYAEALGLSLRIQVEEKVEIDPMLDKNGNSRNPLRKVDYPPVGEVVNKLGSRGPKKHMASLLFWENEAT